MRLDALASEHPLKGALAGLRLRAGLRAPRDAPARPRRAQPHDPVHLGHHRPAERHRTQPAGHAPCLPHRPRLPGHRRAHALRLLLPDQRPGHPRHQFPLPAAVRRQRGAPAAALLGRQRRLLGIRGTLRHQFPLPGAAGGQPHGQGRLPAAAPLAVAARCSASPARRAWTPTCRRPSSATTRRWRTSTASASAASPSSSASVAAMRSTTRWDLPSAWNSS